MIDDLLVLKTVLGPKTNYFKLINTKGVQRNSIRFR